MNSDAAPSGSKTGLSPWRLVLGLLFIALWLGGAFFLGTLKLMASVMATDPGAASTDSHMTLIGGVMGGQVLTALAGIPAGLAFFLRTWRKRLLWTFALLLVLGLTLQILSFTSFFA
jgi:hypothetical protein